jgi:hypothetical protein
MADDGGKISEPAGVEATPAIETTPPSDTHS